MQNLQPNPDTDALLVIDVQNDFCPGGALAVPDGDMVVGPVNRLIERFSTIVFSQDWHPPGHESFASSHSGKAPYDKVQLSYGEQVLWPDHCAQGTAGAAFHASLRVQDSSVIIRKGSNPAVDSYSAFFENDKTTCTGLAGYLQQKNISRLFLSGLTAEYCVAHTALDGRDQGFEIVVVEDAIRALDYAQYVNMRRTQIDAGIRFISSSMIV